MEKNRRVAKAYAKTPILSINSSKCGFEGFKVGVNGFQNPWRDQEVRECKAGIGAGCKLKLSENGDVLIKRIGKGNIFVKVPTSFKESNTSKAKPYLASVHLEHTRATKLFDIKKFKQNLNKESQLQNPDWKKMENQVYNLVLKVEQNL